MSTLPDQVQRYLDATDDDLDTQLATFAPDAVVRDDGRTHTGLAEIRAWREQSRSGGAFTYTRTLLSSAPVDGGAAAAYRIAGDFPGSPVELGYTFEVGADGLIRRLVIAPV